ncbi:4-hydroxythreonine-4-phosphate dehydrogenase PdxA [Streptomyces roseirectus]|uniref:4-hydroxythreonine-4-phosphate dehydrogenase PdxA n=1 Tax=Streptomyces roseirectus TaxID=2768066 RepID=UPI0024833E3A|nr:4-hydroxythreonine-4-phosphate dehydrogenase PdxA [Streptomyces roseirectus]
MVRAGVPEPAIWVCGITPHAGENGLFGHGEEGRRGGDPPRRQPPFPSTPFSGTCCCSCAPRSATPPAPRGRSGGVPRRSRGCRGRRG